MNQASHSFVLAIKSFGESGSREATAYAADMEILRMILVFVWNSTVRSQDPHSRDREMGQMEYGFTRAAYVNCEILSK